MTSNVLTVSYMCDNSGDIMTNNDLITSDMCGNKNALKVSCASKMSHESVV